MAQYYRGLALIVVAFLMYCCSDLNFYYDTIDFIPPSNDSDGNVININSDKRLLRKTFCIPKDTCTLHAWLYYQENPSNELPPLSIIISGLATVKAIAGVPWAEALTNQKSSVLLFDYSHWGSSKGLPRQHINISRQLEDIALVLEFTQISKELHQMVDFKSIHLIGQSLGAGHTTKTLQYFVTSHPILGNKVKSAVLLVPFLSGNESLKKALSSRSLLLTIRTTLTLLFQLVRSWIPNLRPIYIKIASKSKDSEISAMQLSEKDYTLWYERIQRWRARTQGKWTNRVTVQSINQISQYEPLRADLAIKQPIMIIAAENDQLCPYEAVKRNVHKLNGAGKVSLVSMPIGHFEILEKENMQHIATEISNFIQKHP